MSKCVLGKIKTAVIVVELLGLVVYFILWIFVLGLYFLDKFMFLFVMISVTLIIIIFSR